MMKSTLFVGAKIIGSVRFAATRVQSTWRWDTSPRRHTLLLARDDRLLGIVTMDNAGEFLMIQSALNQGRHIAQPVDPAQEGPLS